METIITAINAVFSLMFLPVKGMRPEYALAVITIVCGVVMLFLYKWTSNQAALKRAQDKVKAHILEIRLYQEDLRIMLRALGRVFLKNFVYLKYLMLPATFLMLLVVVIIVQCYPRFQYRPLHPGEGFIFKAALSDGASGPVEITLPAGLSAETQMLAIPSLNEYDWRLSADTPGVYAVKVKAGGEEQERKVVVGDGKGLAGVSPVKAGFSLGTYIENPLEVPLAKGSAFSQIAVSYPEREMDSGLLFGMDWIIYFFVVSFVVALVAKVAFRVN